MILRMLPDFGLKDSIKKCFKRKYFENIITLKFLIIRQRHVEDSWRLSKKTRMERRRKTVRGCDISELVKLLCDVRDPPVSL